MPYQSEEEERESYRREHRMLEAAGVFDHLRDPEVQEAIQRMRDAIMGIDPPRRRRRRAPLRARPGTDDNRSIYRHGL